MIDPKAIARFLDGPRDSYDWLKQLPRQELLDALASLRPLPDVADLKHHQLVGLLVGIACPTFCFWYGMGCVDADTEYLSPTGWRKISAYVGGPVMQYEPATQTGRLVEPASYIVRPCGEMFRFKTTRGIDQKLSAEHTVLYADHLGAPWTLPAEEVARRQMNNSKGWTGRFYTTFTPTITSELPLTDAELRVQVAVIADGHFRYKSDEHMSRSRRRDDAELVCVVSVKKERKKKRIRLLLNNAGIQWGESDTGGTGIGFTRFHFVAPRRDKVFTNFYWQASLHQLSIVSDEVRHWDGTQRASGHVSFFSRSKESADFVQYAFCAQRLTTSLGSSPSDDGKIDYTVRPRGYDALVMLHGWHMNPRRKTQPVTIEPTTDGKKYCFEVPSGFLVLRRNGCIFMSGNTGKTLVSLRLLDYWYRAGQLDKALVLVPSQEAIYSWQDEIARWRMTLPVLALPDDNSTNKAQLWLEFERGIILVSYPSLRAMVSRIERGRAGEKGHRTARRPAIDALCAGVGAMVLDESTAVKDHGSLNHRVCLAIAKRVPIRYALAGRPFGRDPTDLWGQHRVIDLGESLGTTLGLFREALFDKDEIGFGGRRSIRRYKFRADMEEDLNRLAQHRSLRYATEECVELPPLTRIVQRFTLPDENLAYYRQTLEHLIKGAGDETVIRNDFIRLRQLSSGFLGVMADEEGASAKFVFPCNPKLDLLIELLRQVPPGRKAIVFHAFTKSGEMIADRLRKEGIDSVRLWAGTRDRQTALRRFLTDPACTVLNVNAQLGAYALNLQVANYVIYFESPISVIDRDQSERRAWRQGQTRAVFMYDLCMRDGVDELILSFHKQGNDLFSAVMRDPQILSRKR